MWTYRLTYDMWSSNGLDVDPAEMVFKRKSDKAAIRHTVRTLKAARNYGSTIMGVSLRRLDKVKTRRNGKHTIVVGGKNLRIPNVVIDREIIIHRLFDHYLVDC
ncbi:MAG: hypothetical protein A3B91_04515 [Candidatus Yanofskybacteria bacterium RIFCSPHIGHO2_02_FULL_41_29]|uniref:Uncharacterized protein n=1 Tax=Candidatus Yanofskybacteria bacterium RIFCSPHIGHO2_01_FULL_41_53 TaxID=1802663 RepID=A0A1F8EI23_9BACT|nr:MAG: hypothetical protein A2650_03775 [Candidatus Yanofskybacteria bacterium RIFCSPHIGHO2_01_FULL_41_53]OGN11781.1 MAG: hypothetical protein A3B91_04515 [Candidatus Yanofskybacteria bacterium RIFCSPHIGHO2_02_FULL_41_29]OGN18062.1 MAG: hypothetical protein A3F48_03485 [Candidatus Yanofskybacteria bacterium RIFCSPHIGHO2_12_FULL_41_9]OGN22935.1 MAG: hypothetical protein A2916_00970 [Candidatus Yanofskybacteria bacterium RIFCSPLOWO2_01_FULL_41_67]OGN30212.1 MAG: hypothetical protein A3H54_01025 